MVAPAGPTAAGCACGRAQAGGRRHPPRPPSTPRPRWRRQTPAALWAALPRGAPAPLRAATRESWCPPPPPRRCAVAPAPAGARRCRPRHREATLSSKQPRLAHRLPRPIGISDHRSSAAQSGSWCGRGAAAAASAPGSARHRLLQLRRRQQQQQQWPTWRRSSCHRHMRPEHSPGASWACRQLAAPPRHAVHRKNAAAPHRPPLPASQQGEVHANPVFDWTAVSAAGLEGGTLGSAASSPGHQVRRTASRSRLSRGVSFAEPAGEGSAHEGRDGGGHSRRSSLLPFSDTVEQGSRREAGGHMSSRPSEQSLLQLRGELEGIQE